MDLESTMQKALVENTVDFVQLFIDSGVKLKSLLTVGRLEDLYQKVGYYYFFYMNILCHFNLHVYNNRLSAIVAC